MLKNHPADIQVEPEKLFGFYRGVVEDNNDPQKAGRVRVRVFGIHTEKILKTETEGIPVDELPWAEPCLPIVEGSISGFGMWSVPVQGSHVMVFFDDGNILSPLYFASLPGIPERKNPLKKTIVTQEEPLPNSVGFQDPNGVYPRKDKLGEPDVHRLSRGVSEDTLVTTKEENLDQAIQLAYGGSWDEPNPAYAAKYPENFVFTTHGGLTVELDSTPDAKRFHIYHPSNTYIECDNDGNIVFRNQGRKYEIVLQDRLVHILADNYETVDGEERVKILADKYTEINQTENRRVDEDRITEIRQDDIERIFENKFKTVNGNETDQIDGNKDETVDGNKSETVEGNKTKTIEGNETDQIDGNKDETVDGNKDETVGGDKTKDVTGDESQTIGGDLDVVVQGDINITAIGNVTVTSPDVTVTGGLVKLGAQTTMYKLMDERMIALFNTHRHFGVEGGDNTTDGPTTFLSTLLHATANTEAS